MSCASNSQVPFSPSCWPPGPMCSQSALGAQHSERLSLCARSLPGTRFQREVAWDDALALVPSPVSSIRRRPSWLHRSHCQRGRKEKKGRGVGKARWREVGREGPKGEGTTLLCSASASSLSPAATGVLPPHRLPVPRPLLRPPSRQSVQKGNRSPSAADGAVGGGRGCVRVFEGRHLSFLRSQAVTGGGASRSGNGGDRGGGFRSPAAKMLKVTVPSCSASSCSSVTASVAPAAGSLIPDYWIDLCFTCPYSESKAETMENV